MGTDKALTTRLFTWSLLLNVQTSRHQMKKLLVIVLCSACILWLSFIHFKLPNQVPYVHVQHRSKVSLLRDKLKPMTRNDVKSAVFDLLFAAHDVFTRHNLDYFLLGGTLLGSLRTGRLISYDDDVDVGMLRTEIERIRTMRLEAPEGYLIDLESKHHTKFGARQQYSVIPMRIICEKTGIYLDVFQFDMEDDNVVTPWNNEVFGTCGRCAHREVENSAKKEMRVVVPNHTILPYRKCYLEKLEMSCPNNPVALVEYYYGPRWRKERQYH